MTTIWKYTLEVTAAQTVDIPSGSTILLPAQAQDGKIVLWAVVDPAAPPVPNEFRIFGTGAPADFAPDSAGNHYAGSVQLGQFVWHVFHIRPPQ